MNTMKHIFQIIFSFVAFAFFIQACSHDDYQYLMGQDQTTESSFSPLTRSDVNINTHSIKVKQKEITKKDLPDIFRKGLKGTKIKDLEHYSIRTFSEDGSAIIHSVNFDDGGWALVAGRELSENQILAFCEEGSFNPDEIESPEVLFWFDYTKQALKQSFILADREAESPGLGSEQEEEENLLDSFSYDDPYVWVRLDLGSQNSNIITNVNHLTDTQWGPGYPWNYLCPAFGNDLCEMDGSIVAISQLLYYLHYYLGTPSGCYHTVIPSYTWNNPANGEGYYSLNLTRGDYNAPSSRWDSMAQTNPNLLNNSTKYVGNFMIDVADRMGVQFKASGTYTPFITNAFSYFNIDYSYQQYDSSQTITQLDNSMPVIARGTDPSTGYVHTWIIDGYKKEVSMTDHMYKWVTMPTDSLQFYNNINYNYVFTESQMQQFYPDVVENQIDHEYSYSSPSYHYRMNWGWDGSYNNGLYSIYPIGWSAGGYQFSLGTYMMTNFSN